MDESHCCATFGLGTGPVHIRDLYCSGSENKLVECYYDIINGTELHSDDWGVTCNNGNNLFMH